MAKIKFYIIEQANIDHTIEDNAYIEIESSEVQNIICANADKDTSDDLVKLILYRDKWYEIMPMIKSKLLEKCKHLKS